MRRILATKELRERTGYGLQICKAATELAVEKYQTADELDDDQVQSIIDLFYHLARVSGNMGMGVHLPDDVEEHLRQAFIWARLSHCDVPPLLHMNHPHGHPNMIHRYNPFVIVVLTNEIILWRDVS